MSSRQHASASPFFHLDSPIGNWLQPTTGPLRIIGWYVDAKGKAGRRIVVKANGETITCETVSRPDVIASHGGKIRDVACGFKTKITLSPGLNRVQIFAEDAKGKLHKIGTRWVLSYPPAPIDREAAITEVQARLDADLQSFIARQEPLKFNLTHSEKTGETDKDSPLVSVLIISDHNIAATLACVRNLLEISAGVSLEILILDNSYAGDKTAAQLSELLRKTAGIRVSRIPIHASEANGVYLLILNNCALPSPHALQHALESISRQPYIAAVGGRVIDALDPSQQLRHPRVSPQLAPSIAKHVRMGAAAFAEELIEAHETPPEAWSFVDDLSRVFLLVPRALFIAKDTDPKNEIEDSIQNYHAQLRGGIATFVYDPRIVVHFADLQTKQNRTTRNSPCNVAPFSEPVIRADAYRGRILVIDDFVPGPYAGAGAPRILAILKLMLARRWKVTFLPTVSPVSDNAWFLKQTGHEISIASHLGAARLKAFLQKTRGQFDVVWVSRPHNMVSLNEALAAAPDALGSARVIYDAEAVFAVREIAFRRLNGAYLNDNEAAALISAEVGNAATAATVVAVSPKEAALFSDAFPTGKTIEVLTATVESPATPAPGFAARNGFLFIGRLTDDGSPNVDSILWFLREVYPLIGDNDRPPLTIVGDNRAPSLASLASLKIPGVTFVGPADDLTAHYNAARVFIAPTRFAAGVAFKVVESAAHRVAVVCTPLIAGQLGWQHEQESLIGESPAEFAAQCLRLHDDPELWTRISSNAHAHYQAHFDQREFARMLEKIILPFEKPIAVAPSPGRLH